MWPDIFIDVAPRALRPLARVALWPWRRQARTALGSATALTAITQEFLTWGLTMAGRSRNAWDGAYYLAYAQPREPRTAEALATAVKFWDGLGISAAGSFNVVVIGTMTKRRFEMDTVIAAARELQRDGGRVKFILAGDGDNLEEYREQARDCANVLFPGWLTAAQIHELLGRAHLGLVPYRNAADYVMSVPNKVGEYLAAAVPIASCLGGPLERLLAERSCGLQFAASSPASLAALVRKLLSDEPLRLKLSGNARRTYQEELDAATVYGRLVDRLEELAASTAGLRSV
jgi:glycosyltransferase involved in cell wall biosynthesis